MFSMFWALLVLASTALVVSFEFINGDNKNIFVYVYVGENVKKSFARAYGEITEVIPGEERIAWNLLVPQLKDTVNRYIGVWPDDVFITKPVPQEYRNKTSSPWKQVTRTLKPVAIRVSRLFKRAGLIMKTEEFTNTNNHSITYIPNMLTQIVQSVSTSWNISKQLKPGYKINYNVDLIIGSKSSGALGAHEFAVKSDWGKDKNHTKTDTAGIDFELQIQLQAGQKIKSVISMTHGILEVPLTYQATLKGDMACYYDIHVPNIFPYDVNELLSFSGYPTVITSKEVIEIGYYTDIAITITDLRTSQVLYTNAKNITTLETFLDENEDEEYDAEDIKISLD